MFPLSIMKSYFSLLSFFFFFFVVYVVATHHHDDHCDICAELHVEGDWSDMAFFHDSSSLTGGHLQNGFESVLLPIKIY